jgi:protoheme IX farnesyltransferase
VLFATVLFFWSPSHFWSLAIAYKQEYAGARIPMLPAVKGEAHAACSILFNTVGLLVASVLPFILGLAGWTYVLVGVVPGGTHLLRRNLLLVDAPQDRARAMANFHASNLFLLLLFVGVVADAWVRAW